MNYVDLIDSSHKIHTKNITSHFLSIFNARLNNQ